ncbi:MAG: TIGR00725 family protein [Candidatus Omnitrophota bacterium]
MKIKIVGVIGSHACDKEVEKIALNLGKKLSNVANYLVCGGLCGVMQAACQGFKQGGGVTIGIIPSYNKKDANPYVDIVIPTGLGFARNVLVVKSADAVIALPGETGTLSEIAYCLQFGIPVISLKSWDIPGVIRVESVDEAVAKVKDLI